MATTGRLPYMTNKTETCPICTRRVNAPYRRIVDGRIVEGCVDASHTGRLPAASNTGNWHNRPEAKQIRKASAKRLRELLR